MWIHGLLARDVASVDIPKKITGRLKNSLSVNLVDLKQMQTIMLARISQEVHRLCSKYDFSLRCPRRDHKKINYEVISD